MIEKRAVTISTRADTVGAVSGNAIVVEIDGIEIPGVMNVEIGKIQPGELVTATIQLFVRLGK